MTTDNDALAELDWIPILDATSTPEDLEMRISEQTVIALDDMSAQLDGIDFLSPTDRRALLALVDPVIRRQTRDALESAWTRLRSGQ